MHLRRFRVGICAVLDQRGLAAMQTFLADKTRAAIEALGQQHGVPLAGLNTLADCLVADHILARGTFAEADLTGGGRVPFPNGLMVIDGERMGPIHASTAERPTPALAKPGRPLEGIKVLDLGVIVVGTVPRPIVFLFVVVDVGVETHVAALIVPDEISEFTTQVHEMFLVLPLLVLLIAQS